MAEDRQAWRDKLAKELLGVCVQAAPNPTHDDFLSIAVCLTELATVMVFDMLGTPMSAEAFSEAATAAILEIRDRAKQAVEAN